MPKLTSRNPATGEVIQELDLTSIDSLPALFQRASEAQRHWAHQQPRKRAKSLFHLRETILNQSDELIQLISNETGKPKFEALSNELVPVLDTLTYFAHKGPKILKNRTISTGWMIHRKSYLNYWPIGTVAIIAPWNYPFAIPLTQILMALLAGNAVIFKPSEVTSAIGQKIQDLCDEAGFPADLIQTVIGDGTLGAAIIENRPGKIFFTGSPSTGRRIMTAAAQYLIPVSLELGGKDPMIVMPDANLDLATSAALWGGFSNSGQMCASTERLIVHERIAEPFLKLFKEKIQQLRRHPESSIPSSAPIDSDLGVLTFDKQKLILQAQLDDAKAKGGEILIGGDWTEGRKNLNPTVIAGKDVETFSAYQDESFGPVIAFTTFKSPKEAVQKANQNRYGLSASVITNDLHMGEELARQLEVGTVTVNEVAYTYGIPQTPWGGLKESGFGRTHSDQGLLEFANVRHIHLPRGSASIIKALWWFPYTQTQYNAFRSLLELYRKDWFGKFRGLSHFLWEFVHFIKKENRL